MVTNPPPTRVFSTSVTFAAFSIASAPSIAAISPFVSIKPSACTTHTPQLSYNKSAQFAGYVTKNNFALSGDAQFTSDPDGT